MRTFLITGGAGFIGHTVVKQLLNTGHKVIVLDDFSKGKKEYLPESTNLYLYTGDICDDVIYEKIKNEQGKIDSIIHLAAKHFIPECNLDYKKTLETNVVGTGKIIQWANDNNINKMVFASSAAVYGSSHTQPIKESDRTTPDDIYGHSKLLSENLFKLFNGQSIILRLFNVFGPEETHDHLIPKIVKQVRLNETISLGNLSPQRDYVYVEDVRDAILTSLSYEEGSETFNVGSGLPTSVEDVVKKIKSISNSDTEVTSIPEFQRKIDNPYLCADITHIQKIINWKPEHSLDSGLQKTIH